MKMSCLYLPEYVKHVHQKVRRTCGTIICPHSTNHVIDLWRCVCRSRRHLFKLPFVAGQLALIRTFIMILFTFCFHPPSSKKPNQISLQPNFPFKLSKLPLSPQLRTTGRGARFSKVPANINRSLSFK